MPITINQDITVESPNTALLHGTVSDPATIAGVEVFDSDGNDLGPASVKRNGTWTFDAFFDSFTFLDAVATDTSGSTQTSNILGVGANSPLPGQITSVLFSDQETFTVYSSRGRALYDAVATGQSNSDAVSKVTGRGGGRIAYVSSDFGREVLENFRVAGSNHDVLNLADSGLETLADVLRHTTMNGGNATIHTQDHTSVTLLGVTKQQIANHRQDFVFTGGREVLG